jgi:hypothetical protein
MSTTFLSRALGVVTIQDGGLHQCKVCFDGDKKEWHILVDIHNFFTT